MAAGARVRRGAAARSPFRPSAIQVAVLIMVVMVILPTTTTTLPVASAFAAVVPPSFSFSLRRTTARAIRISSGRSTERQRRQQQPTTTATTAIVRRQPLPVVMMNMVSNNKDGGGGDEDPIFYNDFEGFFESSDDDDDSFGSNHNKRKEDSNRHSQNDDDDGDDEEEDEAVDADALGDWRAVRRKLLFQQSADAAAGASQTSKRSKQSVRKPNEQLLARQNRQLAEEYRTSVWAHETSTPEAGGLLVRLPLEVELRRNHRHSRAGERLRRLVEARHLLDDSKNPSSDSIDGSDDDDDDPVRARRRALESVDVAVWYRAAQALIEDEMMKIADGAGEDGQIDAGILNDDASEVLRLYLDQQETWQEVALVLELDERHKTATTVVINRPMALQLTDSLGRLVLHGSFRPTQPPPPVPLKDFLRAFAGECAVYVGGPDLQHEPAVLVHGIAGLEGAAEIAPGVYRGGLPAAVRGVLAGTYRPLDFRFFVGRHVYGPEPLAEAAASSTSPSHERSRATTLDLVVQLGKYQPVACARAVALKQCIQLPQPLWHEVLELCGGELARISELELAKRDDLGFQIVSEDEDDDDDDDDDEVHGLDDDEYDIIVLDEGDDYDDDDDDDE